MGDHNDTSTSGTGQVDWFDALGDEVPDEQRQAAIQEARKMGVEASDDSPWVNEVARLVEDDRPKEAIEAARVHLDLTGSFRFLAVLCTPESPSDQKRSDHPIQTDPPYRFDSDAELVEAALSELEHYIWRADIPPGKSTLDPNLNRCKEHLEALERSVDAESNEEVGDE